MMTRKYNIYRGHLGGVQGGYINAHPRGVLWKKTIATGVVCLFLLNQLAWAYPDTLAPAGLSDEETRQDLIEEMERRNETQDKEQADANEGKCVTADTLLTLEDSREVPIVEIKPGDYVLSLNETTQKIESHRVNGLLDMGVKPVYRLTTASGRSIKTTATHPYLVKVTRSSSFAKATEDKQGHKVTSKWVKVSELEVGEEIAVPCRITDVGVLPASGQWQTIPRILQQARKALQALWQTRYSPSFGTVMSYVLQNNNNPYKKSKCSYPDQKNIQPCHDQSTPLLSKVAIPNVATNVTNPDTKIPMRNGIPEINCPITNAASTSLPTSYRALDSSLRCVFPNVITLLYILHIASIVKGFFECCHWLVEPFVASRLVYAQEASSNDIYWDRIASIEYLGYEQVYDIEVEGTHNFIGNGIFAHNTYMGAAKVDEAGFKIFETGFYAPQSNKALVAAVYTNGVIHLGTMEKTGFKPLSPRLESEIPEKSKRKLIRTI